MPEADDNVTTMTPKNPQKFVQSWLREINDALKREKKFRKNGKHVVDIYEAKSPETVPFNIVYSNTETLVPAIYNSLPIPIVERKYKDPDPVGKSVSEVSTRTLKYLLDNESKDYDCFDDLMQAAVLDSTLTNRGLFRFRYYAHEGSDEECVYGESVRWDKFLHGYARSWKKVPWIAFEWDFSRDEIKENFPKIKLKDLRNFSDGGDPDEDGDEGKTAEDKDELAGVKTYKVYEIWDKVSGKIFFISHISDEPLRYVDDPLGLTGFFPVPKPMNFMRKTTTLVPTPTYEQYKQQAAELNELTNRLKGIIKAIKFRGAYNSAMEGIEKVLTADDNEFVPMENMMSMPDGSGVDKMLWTVPVNELAATAQSLYQQREQCKQVIYEVTGLSDILRGATMASETATAQNIKTQFGTMRLKRMQREVQRYARDCIIIMLEIAAGKFELKTYQQMTGLPYLTNQQKQQVQAELQRLQEQQRMMAMLTQQQPPQGMPPQSQPQGAPGQPPPPGQPPQPPALQSQIPPQVLIALQNPSWEDILQVLHNKLILRYKVDIETNSTIDASTAQDKQDIAELMNALGQFLNGIGPLVEQGVLTIDVAKAMLLTVTRRYAFGSQLEDAINQMQPPQPKQDPNEQAKNAQAAAAIQLENLKMQHETMITNQKMQLSQQEFQQKSELAAQEHAMKITDMQAKQQASGNQLQNLIAKSQASALEHQQRMDMMKQQAAAISSGESD